MPDKLTYEDLKLGEKAQEAYLRGEPLDYIRENCPVYLNTREVFSGLNVTDLVVAAELAGIPTLLVGDTGCGKSQLVDDIYNAHFNGNISQGGQGVKIRGKLDLDVYEEIYTRLNKEKLTREPTQAVQAMIHYLDEINRCPSPTQNQFFGLGDGYLEHAGMKLPLGQKGYSWTAATANLGNGEFQGTFSMDKALYNRFGVAIDFDYEMFSPASEDEMLIDKLRSADPRIKQAPRKDLTKKILQANAEINESAENTGLEASAVINFLRFGTRNCYREGIVQRKGKTWPINCQDCPNNPEDKSLCSLLKSPQPRTFQATLRYASALQYILRLKNPKAEIDSVDLMFKAFELTGAYQSLLNTNILNSDYSEQSPLMMANIVERLRNDFRQNQDFILDSLEQAQQGAKLETFFQSEGQIGDYSSLSDKAKEKIPEINPFTDKREIGLSWVKEQGELERKIREARREQE